MEFKEFVKEYHRMCKFYPDCIKCPIGESKKDKNLHNNCSDIYLLSNINAESIVEKWIKEHPVKTYKTDFEEKMKELLKIFPNYDTEGYMNYNGNLCKYGVVCVADFYFNGNHESASCDGLTCKECWNREIPNE